VGVRVRAVILGAAMVVVVASGVWGQQGRFRAEVDLVNIAVMVMDRQGNFISDLKPDDFALYEDGARQHVTHFLRGDSDAEALNLRLGLLLDTSGSMQDDIALARTAAIRFLRELPEAHDVTLVDFDTEVRVARYGLADLPRLIERIRTRRTAGWTAFYDALGIYLDGVQELDGRKILVVYTDGGDTRSAQTFTDVLEMLKASDVIVYGIGFLQHQPTSVRNEQKMRLQQLADVTGGQTFFPTSPKGLTQVFDQIVAQVRAQYSLGFISSNAVHDGSWRKVEVRLTPGHLQALRIRSRRGYYAPLRDVPPTAILGGAPRGGQ
jgi:Ca-activated chloride channel family protein